MKSMKRMNSIRRSIIGPLALILPVAGLAAAVSVAAAASLGGPMELQDEGQFFIGGQPMPSTHPSNAAGFLPGQIMAKQMFVHYRIPAAVNKPPIVMVHGSGHTGVTYETTPDGREGWATYFTRNNFP